MRAVLELARVISNSDSTAVITGESGTGKEVTATLIHYSSGRKQRPFVPVSCAVLSDTLIESELFGHERGAFTGAVRDRPGRFEAAEGGTIFLDDIDDVPLAIQVKLLRVLQNRTVERVGGTRVIPVNVRVLAGTKHDLRRMVAEGRFREDLYYRLDVLPLVLPPLRDRRDDIPALMEHFLARYFGARGLPAPAIAPIVTEAFMRYDWPGNVRELENACERFAQTCTCGTIGLGCTSRTILAEAARRPPVIVAPAPAVPDAPAAVDLDQRLRDLERSLVSWALKTTHGNKSRAAALLGIKRSTLADRIQRCGLGVVTSATRAGLAPARAS